jgi:hypothetical protein
LTKTSTICTELHNMHNQYANAICCVFTPLTVSHR